MKNRFRKCPYCKSIYVCWNWFNAGGHWGHECWDCENVIETDYKVEDGIPYERCKKRIRRKEKLDIDEN